jgi:hypothetical protein
LTLLRHSEKDTLAFEAAKGCIGVLTVALVGFVVSLGLQTIQRERALADQDAARARAKRDSKRERRRQQAARRLDLQRELWEREVEREREDWRRDVERRRDERQRKDAVLRSVLQDTLHNYHEVKRARRLLRARVWARDPGDRIDLRVYDEQLERINDAQLNFETLKRTALAIDDERIRTTHLASRLEAVEKYLNQLVDEYERKRRLIEPSADQTPSADERRSEDGGSETSEAELTELGDFIGPDSDPFREGASTNIDDVVKSLRAALRKPLTIPPPKLGDPQPGVSERE